MKKPSLKQKLLTKLNGCWEWFTSRHKFSMHIEYEPDRVFAAVVLAGITVLTVLIIISGV